MNENENTPGFFRSLFSDNAVQHSIGAVVLSVCVAAVRKAIFKA